MEIHFNEREEKLTVNYREKKKEKKDKKQERI
jgi:hypothetical protein